MEGRTNKIRQPRQIRRLCQLRDAELFSEVSRGVIPIVENARTYLNSFEALVAVHPGRAVRPATFAEARGIVDGVRQSVYYDGEHGEIEYRNWIVSVREEDLYVDYVEESGDCHWVSPRELDWASGCDHPAPSPVVDLAEALVRLGCGTEDGLSFIANRWQSINISDFTEWSDYVDNNIETVDFLLKSGLSQGTEEWDRRTVIDCWGYPLYSLDLNSLESSKP